MRIVVLLSLISTQCYCIDESRSTSVSLSMVLSAVGDSIYALAFFTRCVVEDIPAYIRLQIEPRSSLNDQVFKSNAIEGQLSPWAANSIGSPKKKD